MSYNFDSQRQWHQDEKVEEIDVSSNDKLVIQATIGNKRKDSNRSKGDVNDDLIEEYQLTKGPVLEKKMICSICKKNKVSQQHHTTDLKERERNMEQRQCQTEKEEKKWQIVKYIMGILAIILIITIFVTSIFPNKIIGEMQISNINIPGFFVQPLNTTIIKLSYEITVDKSWSQTVTNFAGWAFAALGLALRLIPQ